MTSRQKSVAGAALLAALLIGYAPKAGAQATATIVGSVKDAQGGVVPNATVTLTSETRGTTFPGTSTSAGDFIFPNIPGDTYTVSVTLTGFKKVERTGIEAVPGSRVAVPAITLEVGAVSETVEVSAEAPLVQTATGERSAVVEQIEIQNVPVANTFFAQMVALTPGVNSTSSGTPTRSDNTGNVARTNYMLDGVTSVNTGGNQPGITLNMDSIAEVKVLTNSYQAEYGRSSGLQVIGITKSGTDQFHGSIYDMDQHSGWNSNSWANDSNGIHKAYSLTRFWGGTLGGPVGKPGKQHKLFWFVSEQVQPSATGGNINYFRVPTALERQGNFSQTTDNNGSLFNTIADTTTGLPCSSTSAGGCFPGGVIPQSRLNPVGMAILNQYPTANTNGLNYNLYTIQPRYTVTGYQSVMRGDWNASSKLRISGKYAGQNDSREFTYGSIPGFNDTVTQFPALIVPSMTVVYVFSPTLIFEGTVGYTRGNQLGAEAIDPAANRCLNASSALCNFPFLFPNSQKVPPGSYQAAVLAGENAPYYQNGYTLLQPDYSWGSRIANAPPNNPSPGYVNWQYTVDTNLGLTKIIGKHTIKGGFSSQDNMKVQNVGTVDSGVIQIEGALNFGQNSNNPLDTGFGYSNAALGVFQSYAQQKGLIEGRYVYHNNDFYLQDNWKVTKKLTLDMGMRFVHNGPQYDSREQISNFFPNLWQASQAPQLFVPGCFVAGQNPCSSANRVAVNPITLASLGLGSSSIIGDIVPNSGNILNGIVPAGTGINKKTNYSEPLIVYGPRFGAAYALSDKIVLRGAIGLFYDRPQGDAIYGQSGNPPVGQAATVFNSTLAAVASGSASAYQAPPQLNVYNYNAAIPASLQFNFGAQIVVPWSGLVDVSYVQSDNYNTIAWGGIAVPSGYNPLDLNAPDLGTAYLPQYQDPTLGTSTIPGATALTTNLLRPYRGLGAIYDGWPRYNDTYSAIQASYKKQYRNGFSGGFNYTLGIRNTGNMLQQPIVQHDSTGAVSFSPVYSQNASVINNVGYRRNTLKGYAVWELPKVNNLPKAGAYVVNGWQVSAVYTGGNGAPYDVTYSYASNGSNVNLTGSPQYVARIKVGSGAGSGCGSSQYAQINASAFSGPGYNSTGNESGSSLFNYCFMNITDLAMQRSFGVWGEKRRLSFRLDAFNAFNVAVINAVNTTMQIASPATPSTITNNQFLSTGGLNTARITAVNGGFGAATGAMPMRTLQAQLRFTF